MPKEGNNVIGSIAIGKNLSKKISVTNITENVKESNKSIGRIETVIKDISSAIEKINKKVMDVDSVSDKQLTALEKITESIENLNSTAKLLSQLSEEL